MIILGLETATAVCAAALTQGGTILAERSVTSARVHAERLMLLVDECLTSTGCPLEKLDAIAVSIGPGSFTGLRIGLSIAQGLAFAASKPIIGVPTLHALAWQAVRHALLHENEYIVPVLDARHDEIYAALYRRESSGTALATLEEVLPPQAVRLKDARVLFPPNAQVLLAGDGADKLQEHLRTADHLLWAHTIAPPEELRASQGASAALLAEAMTASGISLTRTPEPLYVKDYYPEQHPPMTS